MMKRRFGRHLLACGILGMFLLGAWGSSAAHAENAWWAEGLKRVGQLSNLPGMALDLAVDNDRVYLMSVVAETSYNVISQSPYVAETMYHTSATYISVIDVKKPKDPKLMGLWQPQGTLAGFAAEGDRLYTIEAPPFAAETNYSAGGGRLQIIDMKNPAAPSILGTYGLSSASANLTVKGFRAYFIEGHALFKILDVSNPARPTVIGLYPSFAGPIFDCWVENNQAFLLSQSQIVILDISNASGPREVKRLPLGTANNGWPARICVSGDKVYCYEMGDKDVHIYKWTSSPEDAEVTSFNTLASSRLFINGIPYIPSAGLAVARSRLYMPVGRSGVQVIDLSNLYDNDFMKGYYLTPGDANALVVQDSKIYVATGRRGLTILEEKN